MSTLSPVLKSPSNEGVLGKLGRRANAARVGVFFLDERQNVRPDETASVDTIESAGKRLGATPPTMAPWSRTL